MRHAFLSIPILCLTLLLGACAPYDDVPPAPPDPATSNIAGQAFGTGGAGFASSVQAAFQPSPNPLVFAPSATSAPITIATEDEFVWKTAYIRFGDTGAAGSGTGYIAVPLTGTAVGSTNWLRGGASGTYTASLADAQRPGVHSVYVASCRRSGGNWNCNNGWQVRTFTANTCSAPSCSDDSTCRANNEWRGTTSWQCRSGTMTNMEADCENTGGRCWTSGRTCVANGAIYNSQLCENGNFVALPSAPSTPGSATQTGSPGDMKCPEDAIDCQAY